MDTINLRKDDDGNTVVVGTTETTTPFPSDEIKRQIRHHAEVLMELEAQLKVVETFEASAKTEDTPEVVAVTDSIIDSTKLDVVSPKEAEAEPVEEIKVKG